MDGKRKEKMYSEAKINHPFDKQNRQGHTHINLNFYSLMEYTAESTDHVIQVT